MSGTNLLRVQGLEFRSQAFKMCRGGCGGIASFHELKCFDFLMLWDPMQGCIFLRLKTAALGTNPWT